MFIDRQDAARRLADALEPLRGKKPLVLAIPRGAVPMAKIIAEALDGDLDVVLVRKLGAPGNPEFAVGAIDEAGKIHLGPHASQAGADADYIAAESQRQLALIRERRRRYSAGRAPLDPAGRTVVVVDDGLATGATMHAALKAVRAGKPDRLICALPVAAPDSLRREVSGFADEIVCLATPEDFYAVGQFYRYFPPVSDEEVAAMLDAGGGGAGLDRPNLR